MKLPPLALDGLIVAVLIGAGLLQQLAVPHPEHEVPIDADPVVHGAVIVGAILPLLLRRRFPFSTLVIMGAVIGIAGSVGPVLAYDPSPAAAFGLYFALFNAVSVGGRVRAWSALIISVVAITLVLRPWVIPLAGWLPNYLFPVVAFVAGWMQWQRGELTRILQSRVVDEQAHRERLQQLSLQEVRSGLARDVHDVVVAALRKMSSHAQAALRRLSPPVADPGLALKATENAGRVALVELRRLLDVLREGDPVGQQGSVRPDLGGLEELVRRAVPSSVDVRVRVEGNIPRVPPAVALAACRFVQDTLATAPRGSEGRVLVHVSCTDDTLTVEVRDDRRRTPADATLGRGPAILGVGRRRPLGVARAKARRRWGEDSSIVARFPLHVQEPGEDVGDVVPTAVALTRPWTVDRSRPGATFRVRSALRRLGRRGWLVDLALVAALVTGALLEFSFWEKTLGPGIPPEVFSTAAHVWAVAWILLLFLRRPAPVVTGVAMAVMAFLQTYPFGFWTPVSDIVALQIAVYTIGSFKPGRPHAWVVAVLGAVGLVSIPPPPVTLGTVGFLVIVAITLGGAAYVGTVVGERRRLNAELDKRLAELAEERRTELELALRRERVALAREMHDLVAHSVTLMVVQAGAARIVAATDPEAARRAVATVIDTGRRASEELRQLLSLLATGGDQEPLGPRDLEELVSLARQSGLDVQLERTGDLSRSAGSSLELSAFRIVQEALTNVRKHAPGSQVRVRMRFDTGSVAVRIENDGSPGAPDDLGTLGAGQGLVGMRERVAMFGGRFEAGPRPAGGFVVEALLPLEGVPS